MLGHFKVNYSHALKLSLVVILCGVFLSGCSLFRSSKPDPAADNAGIEEPRTATKRPGSENEPDSVEDLYNKAADALDDGKYREATQIFESVERQYPYSPWSTKAQIMASYAYYENQDYEEAILSLDRFIELHPGNDEIDYAYYLRALSLYEQISDVGRDQQTTAEAVRALDALIRRFPDSKYSRDARLKKDLTRDHLAGKEMEIGRYYLNRNHVNAAINRFRIVVQRYETTSHTPEALHRLVESYLILGVKDEARRVAAVLGHNYPGSKWYERSYALLDDESRKRIVAEQSFVDRTVNSIFKPN